MINISEVINIIHEDYGTKLTTINMAERMKCSPSWIKRKFKKTTGINFNEYLNNVRIRLAEQMLLKRDREIASIALMVGYRSKKDFYKQFRRRFNTTPKKYVQLINP